MGMSCIGSVVRTKCGRDRKRVFLVVGVCNDGTDRVLLADGRLHPLSKPKRKSISHITVLAAGNEERTSAFQKGDGEISSYLARFEAERGDKELQSKE